MSHSVTSSYPSDLHLHPFYLKWAARAFREGRTEEAFALFNATTTPSPDLHNQVYENLWNLRNRPPEHNYGENVFHNTNNPLFSAVNNAQAIERVFQGILGQVYDFELKEQEIHWHLWNIKGQPQGDADFGRHALEHTYGQTSSTEEKLEAARCYMRSSHGVTFFSQNHEVRVITFKKPFYNTTIKAAERWDIDHAVNKVHMTPCDIFFATIPSSYTMTIVHGQPAFNSVQLYQSAPPSQWKWPTTQLPGMTLNLCALGSNQVWQLSDTSRHVVSCIPVGDELSPALNSIQNVSDTQKTHIISRFRFILECNPQTYQLLKVTAHEAYPLDLHIHSFYLRWAAQAFRRGDLEEAFALFNATDNPSQYFQKQIYHNRWSQDRKGNPSTLFHDIRDQQFSAEKNALAIEKFWERIPKQLGVEKAIYQNLWNIKGQPQGDPDFGRHALEHTHDQTSSTKEKLEAVRQYAESSVSSRFFTANREIRIIKTSDCSIELLNIDYSTQMVEINKLSSSLPWNLEWDLRWSPSKYMPTIVNGNPDFKEVSPYIPSSSSQWKWPTMYFSLEGGRVCKIELCKANSSLIWRLNAENGEKRTASFIPVGNELAPLWKLGLDNVPDAEKNAIIQRFQFVPIYNRLTGELFEMTVRQLTAPSLLDSQIILDEKRWGVTLVSEGSSSGSLADTSWGHAAILLEGIQNGRWFIEKIHLRGENGQPGEVEKQPLDQVVILDLQEIRYRHKTPTWIRTPTQIEPMLHMIAQLHGGQEAINFHVTGNSFFTAEGFRNTLGSLFSRSSANSTQVPQVYNCLTFSLTMLRLCGINTPPIDTPQLAQSVLNTLRLPTSIGQRMLSPDQYVQAIAAGSSPVELSQIE